MVSPCLRSRLPGFTLVEMMVVAAVIVILLSITMPAIKSLMDSNQAAEAENTIRANLMAARSYAMANAVLAGVRFQDDGRLVQVYASNYLDAISPQNFYDLRNTKPTYQMKAVKGRQPNILPGNFRVLASGYDSCGMDCAGPDWWIGERWYATCAVLFSNRGRGVHARIVFPDGGGTSGWYPTTSGDFGKWTYDLGSKTGTMYEYQGGSGIFGWQATDKDVVYTTGPNVTTEFKVYDSSDVRGILKNGHVTQDGFKDSHGGEQAYSLDGNIQAGKAMIKSIASDFFIDVNTGMMIRKGGGIDSDVN